MYKKYGRFIQKIDRIYTFCTNITYCAKPAHDQHSPLIISCAKPAHDQHSSLVNHASMLTRLHSLYHVQNRHNLCQDILIIQIFPMHFNFLFPILPMGIFLSHHKAPSAQWHAEGALHVVIVSLFSIFHFIFQFLISHTKEYDILLSDKS